MSKAEEGVEMPIIRYYVHEYFNRPRQFSNDIALIKYDLYKKLFYNFFSNIYSILLFFKMQIDLLHF